MADLVAPKLTQLGGGIAKPDVGTSTERYTQYFDESKQGEEDLRKKRLDNYADVVNTYYDLATSFYEFGWRARALPVGAVHAGGTRAEAGCARVCVRLPPAAVAAPHDSWC